MSEIKLELRPYDKRIGVVADWEEGFEIKVDGMGGQIVISANKAGLTSLAIHLLTLAQDEVPIGCHYHFDQYNSLEDGSNELIVEKIPSSTQSQL